MTFDNQGRASRSLPFPLKNPENYSITDAEGTVLHLTPDFFPPDSDEKIDITLNLSLNEFVAIASALDVGSDITLGDERNLLWWTWVRALRESGTMSCEDIADCIETNEVTQDAIAQAITINQLIQSAVIEQLGGLGNPNSVNPDRTTVLDRNPAGVLQESIKELPECNLDKLWAGIREIVARLDDKSRDLLEDLAIINDTAQRYQAWIDVVPVIGDVAQAIVTTATELIPDILNAFNSHSSEEVLDAIACDLFSMVCAECRYPTFEEIYTYYATLGYDVTNMDVQTTANMVGKLAGMMAGTPVPSVVYHTVVLSTLFTLYLQATFKGSSGTKTILLWAAIGEDFENNNWIDLCETCAQTYAIYVYDFTASQGDSYLDTADGNSADEGVYLAGQGYRLTNSGSGQRLEIAVPFDSTWEVRAVASKTTGATITGRSFAFRPTQGTTSGQFVPNPSNGSGEYNHCVDGLNSITGYSEFATAYQVGVQTTPTFLEKLAIVFNQSASKPASTPTEDQTLCS